MGRVSKSCLWVEPLLKMWIDLIML
jgi:hypothetical protein